MMMRNILTGLLCCLAVTGGAWAVQQGISQKGKTFFPDELSQVVGDKVRITNDDTIPHNIQVNGPDGESKNMGLQMPGDHAMVAVEKPGDYTIRCNIHPKMKLVLHAH